MSREQNKAITVLTDVSLITCIVQRGFGDVIVEAAQAAGAQGATINYARGTGVRERLGIFGLAVEVEKTVISVVVATDQADAVMDHLYRGGGLDTPGAGYIYVTSLEKVAAYIPKSMRERLDAS